MQKIIINYSMTLLKFTFLPFTHRIFAAGSCLFLSIITAAIREDQEEEKEAGQVTRRCQYLAHRVAAREVLQPAAGRPSWLRAGTPVTSSSWLPGSGLLEETGEETKCTTAITPSS